MRTPDFSNEQRVNRRPHTVAPSLASVRLVLVVHQWRAPGSDAGLSNIIRDTMKVLRRNGVQCEAWQVANAQQLMNRLEAEEWRSQRPVTHVVVNPPLGYHHPDMFAEMSMRWTDIEFVTLNHSGMSYISINDNAFAVIRQLLDLEAATHNFFVAGNNPRYTTWIGNAFGREALLLPNLYDTESYINPVVTRRDFDPLRIGSFGEARPWKNQLVAAEAAIAIARRLGVQLELYVNDERWKNNKANMSQVRARAQLFSGLPDARLITVPWEPWPRFRRRVKAMDILFSPSFDETFCCVCADGIAEGVPSVVTGAMEWLPRHWQAEPWDPASVTNVGMTLLHDRIGAVHDGRKALNTYVNNGVRDWIAYLTR